MRPSLAFAILPVIVFISVGVFAQERGTTAMREQARDGKAWLRLAILRQNAAQYRDSEQAYRKAIALLKVNRAALADAMDRMGTMYVECGEFSKAERLERKALHIRESENDVPGTGISHMHLSGLLLGKRKFDSAEAEARRAVDLLVAEGPGVQVTASPENQMSALINLSLARCGRGACGDALGDLQRALNIAHKNYANNSIPVGFTDFLFGYALWKSGNPEPARELMRNGTQELATQLGWGHPMYVRAMRQYEQFLSQAGDRSEAEKVRARIAKFEKVPGTVDVESLMFR